MTDLYLVFWCFTAILLHFAPAENLPAGGNVESAYGMTNPEEQGPLFEGDIAMSLNRNVMSNSTKKWKDGIVPYEFATSVVPQSLKMIQLAMSKIEKYSCIQFRPKTDEDRDYIFIESRVNSTGCWSFVGRMAGKQVINLAARCTRRVGTPIHELMHSLGFFHQQSAHNRDEFVRVIWPNVQQKQKGNFERAAATSSFGLPYDYASVMHYSPYAFANGRHPTIVANDLVHTDRMGQRMGLSAIDIMKLNKMYCSTSEDDDDATNFGMAGGESVQKSSKHHPSNTLMLKLLELLRK